MPTLQPPGTAAMRFEDYSEMLDVGADADAAAIQQACRRHARLLHPNS